MSKLLGILGAGQLSYFLAQEAKKLGHTVSVMAHADYDPAILLADRWEIIGQDVSIKSFIQKVDYAIFENEWVPHDGCESIKNKVFPTFDLMARLSNKAEQKNLFNRFQLPTACFSTFGPETSSVIVLDHLRKKFPQGFVIKHAVGGYDGYGVFLIKKGHLEDERCRHKANEFIRHAFARKISVYGEEILEFEKEVALIAVRSTKGEMKFYPMVETVQEDGTCRIVKGPIEDKALNQLAQIYARKIAEEINIVGILAIEFFLTNNDLIINELAPRVHNSGHFSIDCIDIASQFKNHILAITGKELGNTTPNHSFAMINILGPQNFSGSVTPPDILGEDCYLHWYGKKVSHPKRKLGHLNIIADDKIMLEKKMNSCFAQIKKWENKFLEQVEKK